MDGIIRLRRSAWLILAGLNEEHSRARKAVVAASSAPMPIEAKPSNSGWRSNSARPIPAAAIPIPIKAAESSSRMMNVAGFLLRVTALKNPASPRDASLESEASCNSHIQGRQRGLGGIENLDLMGEEL